MSGFERTGFERTGFERTGFEPLIDIITEEKRKCEDCFEYTPLNCGEHGDCNETGLIAPKASSCPSWHKDHVEQPELEEMQPPNYDLKCNIEAMRLWYF